jgi:hypothetical protein
VATAEIWIDPGTLAASHWGLSSQDGETLLRVAYEPPLAPGARRALLRIVLPSIGLRGSLGLTELAPAEPGGTPPPPLPARWELIPAQELPDLLRGFAAAERERERERAAPSPLPDGGQIR